jgi:hypothetical protein
MYKATDYYLKEHLLRPLYACNQNVLLSVLRVNEYPELDIGMSLN